MAEQHSQWLNYIVLQRVVLSCFADRASQCIPQKFNQISMYEVDDFTREVALTGQNQELMEFLTQRSKETKRHSLSKVRDMLNRE